MKKENENYLKKNEKENENYLKKRTQGLKKENK